MSSTAAGLHQPLDFDLDLSSPTNIPYHFRCPISLELMRDPVTLSTGHTYDRSSIQSWVATGNTTCPITRHPLSDFTLIPNHTLRRFIQDWCVSNPSFGLHRIPTPTHPAHPPLLTTLLNQALRTSFPSRLTALRRLRSLALESHENRSLMAELNLHGILLPILFQNVADSDSELNLEALAIVSMFTIAHSDCAFVASDAENVAYLVNLLFHSSVDVRTNAAAVIESVAEGIRSPELRLRIGAAEGLFEGIIGILNCPFVNPRALKVGVKSLFALCLSKPLRQRAVAAGAVEALIDRLAMFEKCDAERALATVELLCRIPSGCTAFASHPETVPMLVNIILKISDRATEYATGALLSLCSSSEVTRKEAVAAGVLTQLLLLVQSDCTERAKRKAQMLLKVLRDSWSSLCVSNSDEYDGRH